MLTTDQSIEEVDVDALEARPTDAILFDVREPEEYAHGHVPGAISLPQADLALRLSEVPRDHPVYLVCQGGVRSLRSAQFLKQMGVVRVVSVRGGTQSWQSAGKPVALGDTSVAKPKIAESEWTHAGALSYSI
jgi:rhodanese-related sulfurtransferase